jgi:hypothetical protein
MPHTPATLITVLKTDGTTAASMQIPQAQNYLVNVLKDKSRDANLKQALNDVTGGKGKPTGAYRFNGLPVWHASSGNGQKSVSLFYTLATVTATIIAMGEHVISTQYEIDVFGPPGSDFAQGKKINL